MSGFDFDAMRDWEFSFNGFRRKTPVYLADLEALEAVLERFEEISGPAAPPEQLWVNQEQTVAWSSGEAYEAKAQQLGPNWHLTLMIDEERVRWGSAEDVMKTSPRSPRRLEMSSPNAYLELSTVKGGETTVRTYTSGYSGFDSYKLQELVRLVHRYAVPIPWYRRRLHRLGVPPVSVATRKGRDKLDDRRENRRLNRVSAGWGFFGGLLAAVATVVAAWYTVGAGK
jgi:hypothetical protein